ncbi:FAD-dependent oxidoreductase [Nocardioides sp. R-C-SC26]|uniref:FAD-binding oxidoreductase n=1 Tax=Nocardioides sp. R-C-SC26 TaxID=2870414 RepID=UPI001E56BBD9|nr:FAD-binding protein [Nocardioides sp. R-C-SC26]
MRQIPPAAVAALRRRVSGVVAYPADVGYGEYVEQDERPVVVVVAATDDDLVATAQIARDHGLPLHVRATGHGADAVPTGGLLLLTHRLRDVVVDADAETASVSAGARWQDVADAADAHGLAVVSTHARWGGVVGSVLRGGLGPQARRHGLCSEHVVSVRVVGVDGFVHDRIDVEAPDSAAVVVRLTLRLHADVAVTGGRVTVSRPHALRDWVRRHREMPDGVTALAVAHDGVADEVTSRVERAGGSDQSAARWLAQHGDPGLRRPRWQRGWLVADLPEDAVEVLAAFPGRVEVRRLGGRLRHSAGLAGAEWSVRTTVDDVGADGLDVIDLDDWPMRLDDVLVPLAPTGQLTHLGLLDTVDRRPDEERRDRSDRDRTHERRRTDALHDTDPTDQTQETVA